MDETDLIERLRLIEALFASAATEGEKVAAERAKDRILERLESLKREDPPAEYRFSMPDMWSHRVFVALLRRYDIRPYRYRRQRYTTVMAKGSKRFVDETLWPEFREISETLRDYLGEVADRVVSTVLHDDSSEAEVADESVQLSFGFIEGKLHGLVEQGWKKNRLLGSIGHEKAFVLFGIRSSHNDFNSIRGFSLLYPLIIRASFGLRRRRPLGSTIGSVRGTQSLVAHLRSKR